MISYLIKKKNEIQKNGRPNVENGHALWKYQATTNVCNIPYNLQTLIENHTENSRILCI